MSDLTIDDVKSLTGDKTLKFLVAVDGEPALNGKPIDKEEYLYRFDRTLYRRVLLTSQADPRDNEMYYVPVLESLTTNFPEDRIRTILLPSEANKLDFVDSTPTDKEERLYKIGDSETLYRMILLTRQSNPMDNGTWYKPVLESIATNFPEDRIRTILDLEKQNVAKSRILS